MADLYYYEAGWIDDGYYGNGWSGAAAISATATISCSGTKIASGSTTSYTNRTPKTLTINGNTIVSATQSKFGGSSVYFDGTGDDFRISNTQDIDFKYGTGDFTIELWFYKTNAAPVLYYHNGNQTNSYIYSSGTALTYSRNGSSFITATTGDISNGWHHVAVSRASSQTRMFLDGTQIGSTTADTLNYGSSAGYSVSFGSLVGSNYLQGYLDEIRISKGIARYTSNFTPSTTAFTDDSYTVLLVHGDTSIADDAAFTTNVNTAFSLACDAEIVSTVIEASGSWTSTNSITANIGVIREAASTLSSQFTQTSVISHIHGSDLFAFSDAALAAAVNRLRDNNINVSSVFSISTDASRSRNYSSDDSANFTVDVDYLRVRYNQAAVTAAFSLSNSSTRIQQGSVGSPSRTAKTITANGNAAISATQSKFGGKSIALDGTGDYLSVATNTDFGFGTGDFTIEGWFYKTTATTQWFIDTRSTTTQTSVAIQSNGGGSLRLFVNGVFVLTSSSAHTNNAWNHLAVSRASGVTRFFINGVVSTTTYTDTTDYGSTKPLVLGAQFNGTTAFNGYIDEFRVTKGLARYTTTFTAPAAAFVNDTNTVLLVHGDTDISDDPGAGSGLQSAFTQTTSVTRIKEVNSTQTATTTLSADASVLVGGEVVEASGTWTATATQLIVADRFAQFNSSASSAVNLSALGDVTKPFNCSISSSASFTATISHIEGADLLAFTNAAVSVQAKVTRTVSASIAVQTTVSSQAVKTIDITFNANTSLTVSIDPNRLRDIISSQSISTSQSTLGDVTKEYALALNANASLTATISHIEGANLTAFTNASLSAVLNGTKEYSSPLTTTVNFSIDYIRQRATDSQQSLIASLDASSTVTKRLSSSQQAACSLTISIGKIVQGASVENALFSPSITVSVLKNSFAVLDSVSSLTVSLKANKLLSSSLTSTASLTSTLVSTNRSTVSLSSQVTVSCQAVKNRPTNAALTSAVTLSITAKATKRATVALAGAFSPSISVKTYERWWISEVTTIIAGETPGAFETSDTNLNDDIFSILQSDDASPTYYENQVVVKHDKSGTVEWAVSVPWISTRGQTGSLRTGSSNDIYIASDVWTNNSGSFSPGDLLVTKLNSSGTHQWSRKLATVEQDYIATLAVDASDNVYVGAFCNQSPTAFTSGHTIAKFNSSGTLQWQKKITYLMAETADSIVVDDSGNIYIQGGGGRGGISPYTTWDASLVKLDTNGTILWQKSFDNNSLSNFSGNELLSIDPSGNVITSFLNSNDPIVIKFDSSGNIVWQKQLAFTAPSGSSYSHSGLDTDQLGNIFIGGFYQLDTDTYTKIYFIKLDPDGNILYERTLTQSGSGNLILNELTLGRNDEIILTGAGQQGSLISRLPNDGSRTGTWDTFTYSESSYFSLSSSSLSPINSSYSTVNAAYSVTTYTPTVTSVSWTDVFTSLNAWSINPVYLQANFSTSVNNTRVKFFRAVANQIISSQSSTATRTASLRSTPTVVATTTTVPKRFRSSSLTLTSAVTLTITAKRLRDNPAALTSQFSTSTQAKRLRGVVSTQTAVVTANIDNSRIRNFNTEFTSIATELIAAYKNATGTILLESTCSVTALAIKTVSGQTALTASATQTALGYNTQFAQASLSSNSNLSANVYNFTKFISSLSTNSFLNCEPLKIRINEVAFAITSALTAVPKVTRKTNSTQQVTASLTASTLNSRKGTLSSQLTTTTSLTANNKILRLASGNLTARATVTAEVGVIVLFEISLHAFDVVLVSGTVFKIDPYLQIKISAEHRELIIKPETRLLGIDSENRFIKIIPESRILAINSETSVNKIKGQPL